MKHQLPELSFSYDALEPYIDGKTMKIHYSKHHKGYVDKFNNAIKGTKFEDTPIEAILSSDASLPAAIRNNGGGHYNHSLFWNIINPNGKRTPEGELFNAIESSFHSFNLFKDTFSEVAGSRFGSGWAWLIVTREQNELAITSTANQDNPLMNLADIQGVPIFGLDVWEHAYYLKYQNRRADYIDAFWNVVDWEAVESNFKKAKESTWEKIMRYTRTAFSSPGIL